MVRKGSQDPALRPDQVLGVIPRVRDFRIYIYVYSFSWLSFSLEINISPEQQTLGTGAFFSTLRSRQTADTKTKLNPSPCTENRDHKT